MDVLLRQAVDPKFSVIGCQRGDATRHAPPVLLICSNELGARSHVKIAKRVSPGLQIANEVINFRHDEVPNYFVIRRRTYARAPGFATVRGEKIVSEFDSIKPRRPFADANGARVALFGCAPLIVEEGCRFR